MKTDARYYAGSFQIYYHLFSKQPSVADSNLTVVDKDINYKLQIMYNIRTLGPGQILKNIIISPDEQSLMITILSRYGTLSRLIPISYSNALCLMD